MTHRITEYRVSTRLVRFAIEASSAEALVDAQIAYARSYPEGGYDTRFICAVTDGSDPALPFASIGYRSLSCG